MSSDGLSLDQFCALDHAIVSLAGGGFRAGATDEALESIRRNGVVLSVPSFVMLLDVLRESGLASRARPKAAGRRCVRAGIDRAAAAGQGGFTKVAAWHARTHEDTGHRWVRSVLFQTCGVMP